MADRPRAAHKAACAEKPTEVGGAAQRVNWGKTIVNIEWFQITGVPHRGEGYGEPLEALEKKPSGGVAPEKKFERSQRLAPF